MPLLLDLFYGVQGKFLKIFGPLTTNGHEYAAIGEEQKPRITRMTRIFARSALECGAAAPLSALVYQDSRGQLL